MEIEGQFRVSLRVSLDDVSNAIYDMTKRQQIEALILLLGSVDTETARRAIARWEEM